jgi:uncharacterized protein (TIGR02147 family)
MPNIFKYLDYRRYLKDYYRKKKELKGAAFSYRAFSRQAGFSSPNFLQLVMEGKRNLSDDGIDRFVKGLRLSKEEARFFKHLVHFNQAKTDQERNRWYKKLATSKRYREIREIERAQFQYFSHWYNAAIRELVLLPDFQEDPEWIANTLRPKITVKEASEAIELLLHLGFLKRNRSGKLVQAERNISTAKEVHSLAIANFHRQMMKRAAESIERTSFDKRDISSLTIAVSQEKFKEAKRRIQEFRRELNVLLSEDGEADAVYQLNFQIFNLTEAPWPK